MNKEIAVSGVVQGVGFRPFVYQIAKKYALKGFVQNNQQGVQIEVEGASSQIEMFMQTLRSELPPLARIDSIESQNGIFADHQGFEIIQSRGESNKAALISPDISICDNCLKEMQDPSNRRFQYPFINCTDCGPRYSIIKTVPYDRVNTSMHFFKMCTACEKEYSDPMNRRFHAQPVSCFDCGPKLRLYDAKGGLISEKGELIEEAAKAVLAGKILALKGLGGFHIICDAGNSEAVAQLRRRKRREAKPFAVMFKDIDSVKEAVDISLEEEALILSKERPIVVCSKLKSTPVCEEVAPSIDRLGVFLPYTPLHHLLLEKIGRPVVATSANLKDEPIITEGKEVLQKLGQSIDLLLDHDRGILNANDDSVMQLVGKEIFFLRMARGFAPKSIQLPFKSKHKILALGGHQKNTISLLFDDKLVTSVHIGDLNSIEAFEYFERTLQSFERIYDFKADVIVCDKHPEYETSRWAKEEVLKKPALHLLQVQHHYAHLLSVMAEHKLSSQALGFAFDGTGYGDDGQIWGSEVMLCDTQGYERKYSLSSFRLLGAEKAVKEPRRSALSLLFEMMSLEEVLDSQLPTVLAFSKEEITLLHQAWEKGINAPYTTSMGRVFDALASLASVLQLSSYEGESGLMLEALVDENITESFDFEIGEGKIDLRPVLGELIQMKDPVLMVSMFFNTLVEIIFKIAGMHPELPLLFSGGVFQNRTLVAKIQKRSVQMKRRACFAHTLPVNDGGISVGQAWFALHNSQMH